MPTYTTVQPEGHQSQLHGVEGTTGLSEVPGATVAEQPPEAVTAPGPSRRCVSFAGEDETFDMPARRQLGPLSELMELFERMDAVECRVSSLDRHVSKVTESVDDVWSEVAVARHEVWEVRKCTVPLLPTRVPATPAVGPSSNCGSEFGDEADSRRTSIEGRVASLADTLERVTDHIRATTSRQAMECEIEQLELERDGVQQQPSELERRLIARLWGTDERVASLKQGIQQVKDTLDRRFCEAETEMSKLMHSVRDHQVVTQQQLRESKESVAELMDVLIADREGVESRLKNNEACIMELKSSPRALEPKDRAHEKLDLHSAALRNRISETTNRLKNLNPEDDRRAAALQNALETSLVRNLLAAAALRATSAALE